MEKGNKNPLTHTWNWLGSAGGVLSLSSMTEGWRDDLAHWQGFIADIIEVYRAIVQPIFDAIFVWLPFFVPQWVGDYYAFGLICGASWLRTMPVDWTAVEEAF